MIVLNTMYERLIDLDEKSMPMPGLASKWTVSSDGLVYTFHLRQGVKFHNGRELTAEDVVYSYNRLMDPKTKYPFSPQVQNIKEVKALDKYTAQITLKARRSPSWFICPIPTERMPSFQGRSGEAGGHPDPPRRDRAL